MENLFFYIICLVYKEVIMLIVDLLDGIKVFFNEEDFIDL